MTIEEFDAALSAFGLEGERLLQGYWPAPKHPQPVA